ncbi:hypothetical protein DIPPA_02439 [Diplonema papillatum]|nr:hypothetical protein DIPPA_02439 [Diplonema papillatum]
MVSELRRPKVKSGSQSPRAAPGKSSTAGARSASAPAPRLGRKLGKEYLRQAGHLPAKSKRANRGESAGTVVETESEKEAREAKARRKLGNHYMSDASKLVSRGPDGSPIVSKEEHPVESLTAMRSRVKHLDRALESALQQASTNPDALSQQKQTLLACNAAKAKLVLLEQLSTAKTNP